MAFVQTVLSLAKVMSTHATGTGHVTQSIATTQT